MAENGSAKERKKVIGVWIAIGAAMVALVVVVAAVWFQLGGNGGILLSEEYYCDGECEGEIILPLSSAEYGRLAEEGKSFLVFVDQVGCTDARELEGFVEEYARAKGVKLYRMQFADIKKTELGEAVKFYPSVAVVQDGRPAIWLAADSEADAAAYNNYEDFYRWMERYLQ